MIPCVEGRLRRSVNVGGMFSAEQGAARPAIFHKQQIELADGRDLFYFDDSMPYASGECRRDGVDRRELPPARPSGEMRYDELSGSWIAMAAHRMDRTFMPPADACPLCPTQPDGFPSEIPAADYDVAVFENQFPSFSTRAGELSIAGALPANGRCEVVCFTSQHDQTFAELTPQRARTVIEAWIDRTTALSAIPGVRQVFCFENRGREIGVTLQHPHGQIYAYPYITPRTGQMLSRAEAHLERTGRSLLQDVLRREQEAETRVILRTSRWTAYVPFAARWPVQVHLAPERGVPDLASLDNDERAELAEVYLELLRRLDRYFPGESGAPTRLPYIAGWHQSPPDMQHLGRLHLQISSVLRAPGKLKYLAGSESGMDAWVNDTTPERIAARLREVATV